MASYHWLGFCFTVCCGVMKAAADRPNLRIYPNPAYLGDCISFDCNVPAGCAPITINISAVDRVNGSFQCTPTEPNLIATGLLTDSCSGNGTNTCNVTSLKLNGTVNATTALNTNYKCSSSCFHPNGTFNMSSDAVQLVVNEKPEAPIFSPVKLKFSEEDAVVRCSAANGSPAPQLRLNITNNNEALHATGEYNVTLNVTELYKWNGASATCEITNHNISGLTVTKEIVVFFIRLTGEGRTTFENTSAVLNCSKFVESNPPANFTWWAYNSSQDPTPELLRSASTNSTFHAEHPHKNEYSCIATNDQANKRNVTVAFVAKSATADQNNNNQHHDKPPDLTAILASVSGAAGAAILIVVVITCRKRRSRNRQQKVASTGFGRPSAGDDRTMVEDDVTMQDNVLYESSMPGRMPRDGAREEAMLPLTNQYDLVQLDDQAEGKLVISAEGLASDLKEKALDQTCVITYSDQQATARDILGKIERMISQRSKPRHVALLLRSNYNGLLLSKADKLIINSKNASSDVRLRDFFSNLVNLYMDSPVDGLRIDLLNCTKLSAVERTATAEALTRLVEVPVTISLDLYGASTRIDFDRTVADFYFQKFGNDNILYAELELPKDVHRAPADTEDRVVYSEVRR